MVAYNVWRTDVKRWIADLSDLRLPNMVDQDADNPVSLTYAQARQILEKWREAEVGSSVEVRELLPGGIPGTEAVGYNIWINGVNRWTNYDTQEPDQPTPLTYHEAFDISSKLDNLSVPNTVMEMGSDYKPQPMYGRPMPPTTVAPSAPDTIPAPPPDEIDFSVYNGITPDPKKYGWQSVVVKDPYTGLVIEKKEKP